VHWTPSRGSAHSIGRRGELGDRSWAASILAAEVVEQRFQDDIEDGDKKEIENRGDEHAADYGCANGVAAKFAGSSGDDEGEDAEDEGERRHEDGAETKFGGLDGGFGDGASLAEELLGELDDEDGVFGGEADEHHQADLAVDVVGESPHGNRAKCPENCHGHGEQDDEGEREAFVLSGQGQIDDQEAESEDDDGLAAGFDFFEGEAGPGIGHPLQHVALGQGFHGCESLGRAATGSGRAVDLCRTEEIVVVNDLRTRALFDSDEAVEGNHLIVPRADVVLANVFSGGAELLIGLDVDAVGTVVVVEVVDVSRAHVYLKGVSDLVKGDVHRLGFFTVDGNDHLRVVGSEGGVEVLQLVALAAFPDDLIGDVGNVLEGVASEVLEFELEAAESADALDGGGFEGDDESSRNHKELGRNAGDYFRGGVAGT